MDDFIELNGHKHIRYIPQPCSIEESLKQSRAFLKDMKRRKSIRHFSSEPIPLEVMENIIATAGSAPSGANKQPWTFCLVSNPELKKQIRIAAEKEERKSYEERMNKEWLEDLEPLGTNHDKPFLEEAPYLIIVFKKAFEYNNEGTKRQNYYVNESVGIACGMLISAIQMAGLSTLTHTPSPMNFLSQLLERPDNERPYLLLPVGYPAEKVYVPNIEKKSLDEILIRYD